MTDYGRSRTSTATLMAYIKSTITSAATSWNIGEYAYTDIDNILKAFPSLRSPAIVLMFPIITPNTYENPDAPMRRMKFGAWIYSQSYQFATVDKTTILNMGETLISALDMQFYNSNVLMLCSQSEPLRVVKNAGVMSIKLDIIAEDY
jgi:hypothetical protein